MKAFAYAPATSAEEAVRLVEEHPGAKFLGGGTNLVDLMRLGVEAPGLLVDVSVLPLGEITERSGALVVGAAVRNSDLAADPRVRAGYPAVSQALLAGASGQLRNMATVAGNLLQRTRCLYFQDTQKPCNKRQPGSGCPARTGVHRDLAILGASEACVATHPGDFAVALAALDAVVLVTGPAGERRLTLDEFYRLPGEHPEHDTVLGPADLITGIELPEASALTRNSAYRKARDRASYAFAAGSVAAAITTADAAVQDVRIALGAVAHRPWRARTAERALIGGPATPEAFRAAMEAELEQADPLPDNAFKVALSRNLASALLEELR